MTKIFMLFILFVILMTEWSEAGLPPTTLGNLNESAKTTTFNFKVPNKQSTKITGGGLIETGNKNILSNASFEADLPESSWVTPSGVVTINTSTVIDGAKSWQVSHTAEPVSIYQDSTLYASQFADGVDGLVGIWVKTALSDIYVCARAAGASLVSSKFSNCVAVSSNNKWAFYQVPTILGATSNGVEVASYNSSGVSVAVTGDVYIDDAIVGAFPTRQTVDQSKIAGESYFAGTTNCVWTRTSTTVGAFATDADCPGPTTAYSSMGSWQTTDADLPRQTINNLPAGVYKAKFIIQTIQTTGGTSVFAINDGATTCEAVPGANDTGFRSGIIVECTFTYQSAGNRVFELYTASSSGTVNANNDFPSAPRASTKFILEYFGNSSIYSASCGANCVDSFPVQVSSGGTVLKDDFDIINGNCSLSGTSNETKTCSFNTGRFNVAPVIVSTPCASTSLAQTDTSVSISGLSNTSAQFTTRDLNNTPADRAFCFVAYKNGADFTASRTIVGSFKEVVTSVGSTAPDIQSVYFGSGTNCASNCTTGTCSICTQVGSKITSVTWNSTGAYNINGIDGTKYICNGNGLTVGVGYASAFHDRASSPTTFARVTFYAGGSQVNAGYASVTCIGNP